MRNNVQVKFNLDHLSCYDEGDGAGSAEPYLWTVFFMIDGSTCRLNDVLKLQGTATVFSTPGSQGNLGTTDVDGGQDVPIPAEIGFQDMILTPIPVPDAVKKAGTDDVTAIVGCIAILMEEDNVSGHGAEAGHRALNAAVQTALDSLIPTLGFDKQDISDEDIAAITAQIQDQVIEAIKNDQSTAENIWTWFNPDDTIGTVVWKFSVDELLAGNPKALQQRWTNEGDWELFGSIETLELPTCPADVLKDIFDAIFGKSASADSMKSLYDFEAEEMKKYDGLDEWWDLARRNTAFLYRALEDKDVSDAGVALFRAVPDILNKPTDMLADEHTDAFLKLLHAISKYSRKADPSRIEIPVFVELIHVLKKRPLNEIFEVLSIADPDLESPGLPSSRKIGS